MTQIDKEYTQPFLIEPTKLTRIVDKIHERLHEHADTTTHDSFEVFMSGNRREAMDNVDAVLALDNSSRQKIQRLLLSCTATSPNASHPEHEVQVDFGKPRAAGTTGTTGVKVVEISVRSEEPGWVRHTLSEVEEQVERTWQPRPHLLVILFVALLLVLLGAVLFRASSEAPTQTLDILRSMWLRDRDVERLEQMVGQNRTLTDEEMREIFTRQLRNVLDDAKPPQSAKKGQTRQAVLTLVPIGIVLVCFIVLLKSYPSNVFLWGDEVGRYENILQRRKIAWGIIVGCVIIGVGGKFLSENLLSYFPP
jgi:hypothetical protein